MNTILLKLNPSASEKRALLDTMRAFNSAKNYILHIAHATDCFNKHKLSNSYYYELKNSFLLPSQMVVSVIGTVVEDHKKNAGIVEYNETDSVFYDKRVVSFKGLSTISLTTTIGRLLIKFEVLRYNDDPKAPKQVGCATLSFEKNSFLLSSVL